MSRERWQELDRHAPPAPWVLTRDHGGECEGLHLIRRISDPVMDDAIAEFIAAARTAWPAAERECDQLRADNAALRTELLMLARTANPSTPSEEAVVRQELDEANAAAATAQGIVGDIGAENSQLRAERDQAITLIRQVMWCCGDADHDGLGSLISALITTSGLLDDEGQQP